jgi:hypothetical protein
MLTLEYCHQSRVKKKIFINLSLRNPGSGFT